jgi:hypothetical protein
MPDDITFLKGVHTDQFNHSPAQLMMRTGGARLGKPSIGGCIVPKWVSDTAIFKKTH